MRDLNTRIASRTPNPEHIGAIVRRVLDRLTAPPAQRPAA